MHGPCHSDLGRACLAAAAGTRYIEWQRKKCQLHCMRAIEEEVPEGRPVAQPDHRLRPVPILLPCCNSSGDLEVAAPRHTIDLCRPWLPITAGRRRRRRELNRTRRACGGGLAGQAAIYSGLQRDTHPDGSPNSAPAHAAMLLLSPAPVVHACFHSHADIYNNH